MSDQQPYKNAIKAYGSTQSETSPRALEGRLLMESAQRIEEVAKRLQAEEPTDYRDIADILEINQKLWVIFSSDMGDPENPLPQEIKNNIASLGFFIFKRTKDMLADPTADGMRALININRNIAAGLLRNPGTGTTEGSTPPPATPQGATDSQV